jgi:hypothetical protein
MPLEDDGELVVARSVEPLEALHLARREDWVPAPKESEHADDVLSTVHLVDDHPLRPGPHLSPADGAGATLVYRLPERSA